MCHVTFFSLSAFECGKSTFCRCHVDILGLYPYFICEPTCCWCAFTLSTMWGEKIRIEKVFAFSSFMQLFPNSMAKVYCKQDIMMKISWTTNILSYNRFAVLLLYLQKNISEQCVQLMINSESLFWTADDHYAVISPVIIFWSDWTWRSMKVHFQSRHASHLKGQIFVWEPSFTSAQSIAKTSV